MNIDYKKPISKYTQNDYRTSQTRSYQFISSSDRHFVPSKAHILCEELKITSADYRPRSESAKEFQWKINRNRNIRANRSMTNNRVNYIHQFSDEIKATEPINLFKISASDKKEFMSLPKEVKFKNSFLPPQIEHAWRETYFTSTPGYYPLLDGLVSTTEIDYHRHKNYSDARTNLIPRVDLPFNSNVAFFTPKSKLIKENPLTKIYKAQNTRDLMIFPTPSYDRITITKVPYRGLESEMQGSY